ncbi:hypothetical protein FZEAL_3152 [Fusarium zealandicum]|uniref:Uncharacterized protein n=1 Tax=Fusarium zealandicum TaxID=1053134 RepID=A0A8H4UPC7_9HYPO|nr:hypothetical protein FZEAL_3152 [Fusarium zealandicum]
MDQTPQDIGSKASAVEDAANDRSGSEPMDRSSDTTESEPTPGPRQYLVTWPESRDPSPHVPLHNRWEANTRRMSRCDYCNANGIKTLQQCVECKSAICKECFTGGKIDDRHFLDATTVDWNQHLAARTSKASGRGIARPARPARPAKAARPKNSKKSMSSSQRGAGKMTGPLVAKPGESSSNYLQQQETKPLVTPSTALQPSTGLTQEETQTRPRMGLFPSHAAQPCLGSRPAEGQGTTLESNVRRPQGYPVPGSSTVGDPTQTIQVPEFREYSQLVVDSLSRASVVAAAPVVHSGDHLEPQDQQLQPRTLTNQLSRASISPDHKPNESPPLAVCPGEPGQSQPEATHPRLVVDSLSRASVCLNPWPPVSLIPLSRRENYPQPQPQAEPRPRAAPRPQAVSRPRTVFQPRTAPPLTPSLPGSNSALQARKPLPEVALTSIKQKPGTESVGQPLPAARPLQVPAPRNSPPVLPGSVPIPRNQHSDATQEPPSNVDRHEQSAGLIDVAERLACELARTLTLETQSLHNLIPTRSVDSRLYDTVVRTWLLRHTRTDFLQQLIPADADHDGTILHLQLLRAATVKASRGLGLSRDNHAMV